MTQTPNLNEYLSVVKRRKYYFLIPFVSILIFTTIIAFIVPPIYKSTCTILIEDQQIPLEFARSTVNTAVDQIIETITQRVMTRAKIQEIIDQFNLYPDRRKKDTSSEIINRMRKDIELKTISAEVKDQRTGKSSIGTIAFNISYKGDRPDHVQKVTNVLASLYLEQNVKFRQEKARTTSSFLEAEIEGIGGIIDNLEKQLSDFKQKHFYSLPEMSQLNFQMVQRLEQELKNLDQQICSVKERQIYLEGQLVTLDPHLAGVDTQEGTYTNSEQRLEYLNNEYVLLKASYSEKHPDLIKIKKEIDALGKEVNLKESIEINNRQLKKMKEDLISKKAVFSDKHPDIVKLKNSIKVLEQENDALMKKKAEAVPSKKSPKNPAYITLKMQITTAQMDLRNLKKSRAAVYAELNNYLKRLELGPRIEREYQLLTRDYENARIRYQQILGKLMEAKTAEGLESSQKGQRFTIIDPATYPQKPFKPNRKAIVLIGFILGLGSGVGLASLREFADQSVWSETSLLQLVDKPVLAVIPFIETGSDIKEKKRSTLIAITVIVVCFALLIMTVHIFYQPIDILWFKAMRRISL